MRIFWDLDGTLTGYPNGFVSLDYEYNHFPSSVGTIFKVMLVQILGVWDKWRGTVLGGPWVCKVSAQFAVHTPNASFEALREQLVF